MRLVDQPKNQSLGTSMEDDIIINVRIFSPVSTCLNYQRACQMNSLDTVSLCNRFILLTKKVNERELIRHTWREVTRRRMTILVGDCFECVQQSHNVQRLNNFTTKNIYQKIAVFCLHQSLNNTGLY